MRKVQGLIAAFGAASLIATPVMAQGNPAAALSVAKAQGGAVRAGTATRKTSGIAGVIYPIVIIAIVGATLGFAIGDSDGSEPDSK